MPNLKSIQQCLGVAKVIRRSYITLATAKKAPSHGNFSKILSKYGAHVQGLTAVERTEFFFVWLKLCACHITLASQISQLLINDFKFCFMVAW